MKHADSSLQGESLNSANSLDELSSSNSSSNNNCATRRFEEPLEFNKTTTTVQQMRARAAVLTVRPA